MGRIAKKTTEYFYFVPANAPVSEKISVALPDGTALRFEAPSYAAGQILKFQMQNGAWGLTGQCKVPDPSPVVVSVDESVSGPYGGVLDVVKASGFLKRLPLSEDGVLHVSVPFCAGFQEYGALGNFLAADCLPQLQRKAVGVDVLATEIFDRYSFSWATAQRWLAAIHPQISLRTATLDLALDSLPTAGLFIAIHPEVTRGGCWFQIMGSIIKSCNGLCVIACFWETEKDTVLNMIEMYKKEGSTVQVHENPYYDTHEKPFAAHMRYVILVASPTLV